MIELPKSVKTEILADWAEASCLFGSSTSISKEEIEESLENDGIDNSEEIASNIWQEIEARHIMMGNSYPVRTLQGMLERIQPWEHNLAYTFQLLLAMGSYYPEMRITSRQWPSIGKLYECVATLVMRQYLHGDAINTGSPRKTGVPSRFSDCLDYLCNRMSEVRGAQRLYKSKNRDDGVDVVAWNPFRDMRPGKLIILVQCAAGKDWRSKIRGSEISLGLWQQHINFATKPLKAFVFPLVCIDNDNWARINHESEGLVLDRLRVASMFVSDSAPHTLLQKIQKWCKGQLKRLPWAGV